MSNERFSFLTLTKTLLLCMVLGAGLTACDRDEGGFEESGENMDEAMTDFGNAVEDACEDMKEGAGAADQDC